MAGHSSRGRPGLPRGVLGRSPAPPPWSAKVHLATGCRGPTWTSFHRGRLGRATRSRRPASLWIPAPGRTASRGRCAGRRCRVQRPSAVAVPSVSRRQTPAASAPTSRPTSPLAISNTSAGGAPRGDQRRYPTQRGLLVREALELNVSPRLWGCHRALTSVDARRRAHDRPYRTTLGASPAGRSCGRGRPRQLRIPRGHAKRSGLSSIGCRRRGPGASIAAPLLRGEVVLNGQRRAVRVSGSRSSSPLWCPPGRGMAMTKGRRRPRGRAAIRGRRPRRGQRGPARRRTPIGPTSSRSDCPRSSGHDARPERRAGDPGERAQAHPERSREVRAGDYTAALVWHRTPTSRGGHRRGARRIRASSGSRWSQRRAPGSTRRSKRPTSRRSRRRSRLSADPAGRPGRDRFGIQGGCGARDEDRPALERAAGHDVRPRLRQRRDRRPLRMGKRAADALAAAVGGQGRGRVLLPRRDHYVSEPARPGVPGDDHRTTRGSRSSPSGASPIRTRPRTRRTPSF